MTAKVEYIKKICATCGKVFEIPPCRRDTAKYCSVLCQNKGMRKGKEYTCDYCGKYFYRPNYQDKSVTHRFCSTDCHIEWRKENQINAACHTCGETFLPKRVGAIYCSRKCAYTSFETFQMIECDNCGKSFKEFKSVLAQNQHYFCSRECYVDFSVGENHPNYIYGRDRFRGDNWHLTKKRFLKKHEAICLLCGNKNTTLDIHHITPFRLFQNYEEANKEENLALLCRNCHPKVEWMIRKGRIDKLPNSLVPKVII